MAEELVTRDPKSWSPRQYINKFVEFMSEYELDQVKSIVLSPLRIDEHQSFIVHAQDLIHFDSAVAFMLIYHPAVVIPLFDEACLEIQKSLISHPSISNSFPAPTVKKSTHVRLTALPPVMDVAKTSIGDIRAHDFSSLLQINGTVVRTGPTRMLEVSKEYECQNPKCRHQFTVRADPEQDHLIPQPRSCPSGSTRANDSVAPSWVCRSKLLREVEGSRECVDYQEVKLMDRVEHLTLGSIPRSIVVILHADLVDKFNAGDNVVVVGTLVRQWRFMQKGTRGAVDMAVVANSVINQQTQEKGDVSAHGGMEKFKIFWAGFKGREWEGRNVLLKSVCPQLFGLFHVKLSLLLTLVGGSEGPGEGTVRRRAQSHLLLVGDPGCGKSQLLRFAAGVTSRSVLTTGVGTTGAGLTCSAVRDGGDWALEAGALVLASGGVCCIDEFASMREHDRITIHEAMEQQTISVAKAGLVTKLPSKTTVVACCNPKGNFDPSADLTANTAIGSPLLSRFDLVLVLVDTPQKEWDKQVSTFLLMQAVERGFSQKKKRRPQNNTNTTNQPQTEDSNPNRNPDNESDTSQKDYWEAPELRKYILCVKKHFNPVLSDEARALLSRYYQYQRQSEDRSSARTTVRLLESLMRLSEAHARIMFREKVLLEDAVVAISCNSLSQLHSSQSLLEGSLTGALKEGFSENPKTQYQTQEDRILRMLQCTRASLLSSRDNSLIDREIPGFSQNLTSLSQTNRPSTSSQHISPTLDENDFHSGPNQVPAAPTQIERTFSNISKSSPLVFSVQPSPTSLNKRQKVNSHSKVKNTIDNIPTNNEKITKNNSTVRGVTVIRSPPTTGLKVKNPSIQDLTSDSPIQITSEVYRRPLTASDLSARDQLKNVQKLGFTENDTVESRDNLRKITNKEIKENQRNLNFSSSEGSSNNSQIQETIKNQKMGFNTSTLEKRRINSSVNRGINQMDMSVAGSSVPETGSPVRKWKRVEQLLNEEDDDW